MTIKHQVKQGDCIDSIACDNGFFPKTIWGHSANSKLNQERVDQNVLFPGDVVEIPDKQMRQESGTTGQRHRFRRKGVPAKLRLQFMLLEEPLSGEPYTITIDNKIVKGTTDADGRLDVPIPPNANSGKIVIGTDEDSDEFPLNLGALDPVTEISGVQTRLNHLGYDCGVSSGELNSKTREALELFQRQEGLPETGEPDATTQDTLKAIHGS